MRLPMCEYELPEGVASHADMLRGHDLIVGVRPEHFEEIAAVGRSEQGEGARFTARIDLLEWLGSDLFAHFSVQRGGASSRGLSDVAEELSDAGVRQAHDELTVARIDPASEISEGQDAEFWLDVSRLHYFDAESGENLLMEHEAEVAQGAEAVTA